MATSEWRELLRVLEASPQERDVDTSLLEMLMRSFGVGEGVDTMLLPRVSEPAPRSRVEDVVLAGLPSTAPAVESVGGTAASSGATSGDSTAETVMKTIGMITGVGPLVTGLVRLFGGGGGDEETPVAPLPYSLPEQISVEAGLAGDRSFVPVAYSSRGVARAADGRVESGVALTESGAQEYGRPFAPAAQIQVNVQAMDSRSFLDHSDEIARAVRDAMLRSHSLNDVVAEL